MSGSDVTKLKMVPVPYTCSKLSLIVKNISFSDRVWVYTSQVSDSTSSMFKLRDSMRKAILAKFQTCPPLHSGGIWLGFFLLLFLCQKIKSTPSLMLRLSFEFEHDVFTNIYISYTKLFLLIYSAYMRKMLQLIQVHPSPKKY